MTAKITLKMLSGACDEQKAIFASEWPKGAEATLGNVRRAQELGLDLEWGTKWFTPEPRRLYDAAVALFVVLWQDLCVLSTGLGR